MELQDYLRIIRKRWMTIVITALVVVGLAALWTVSQPKRYTSSTRFFVSVSGADTAALQQGSTFTIEQGELVNPQASVRAQGRYAPQDTNLTAQIGVADYAPAASPATARLHWC